jgi:PKD repeat protein
VYNRHGFIHSGEENFHMMRSPTQLSVRTLTRLFLIVAIIAPLFSITAPRPVAAQGLGRVEFLNVTGIPYNDRLVFHRIFQNNSGGLSGLPVQRDNQLRITNVGTGPLRVEVPVISGPDADTFIVQNMISAFNIAPGDSREINFRMQQDVRGNERGIRNAIATIATDDPTTPSIRIELAGFMQPRVGGAFEPNLQEIFDVFDYATVARYPNQGNELFNNGTIGTYGDEVVSQDGQWMPANPDLPVYVRYLVATHGDTAPRTWGAFFQFVPAGGTTCVANPDPDNPQDDPNVGRRTAPCIMWHNGPDWQRFFPRLFVDGESPASTAVAEMSATFGGPRRFFINIDGWRSDRHVGGQTQGVRFYPLRLRDGRLVPNTYLVAQDYAQAGSSFANFDYQDSVFLVTNIRPRFVESDTSMAARLPGSENLILEFDREYTGTLVDANNRGTGFTDVQRNSIGGATADVFRGFRPASEATNSYDPTALNLDPSGAGTLQVTTRDGTNAFASSSLVNGLCLPFNAGTSKFVMQTRILSPLAYTSGTQHAGLMFGPNQYDYIRFVTRRGTGGALQLGLSQKINNGTLTQVGDLVTVGNLATFNSIDLHLTGNPLTGVVEAAYSVDGGAFQTLPQTITLEEPVRNRFFERNGRGCILAFHRSTTGFVATFDRFAIVPAPELTAPRTAIRRYNVGGPTVELDGNTWLSDAGLFSPTNAPNEGSGTPAIANTTLDTLYQRYRGRISPNPPADQRFLTYTIPLLTTDPQTVSLRLHFAELFWGLSGRVGPNQRLFDVYVQGERVLRGFDIFSNAGAANTAVVVPIENIQVDNGVLTLMFHAQIDNVAISAIEVLEQPLEGPIVNAGPDQTVDAGDTVTLNGDVTMPDGDPLNFTWTQRGGPTVTLNNADTLTPSFVAAQRGTYIFELSSTRSDQVTIAVSNSVPTVDASALPTTVNVGQPSTLSAIGNDADGDTLAYSWARTSGPTSGTLTNANTATATFTPTERGTYVFTVTVTDGFGGSNTDTATVTVNNRAPTITAISATPPTVDVGVTTSLSVTASDLDGDTLNYSWAQTSGPAGAVLVNANSANPTFTPGAKGSYEFTVTVTDGFGGSASEPVTVTVNNRAPTANAGSVQSVLVNQSVQLNGTASSDPDGDPLSYTWTQTGGPAVTLTDANAVQPSFVAPAQPATLTFSLVVADDENLTSPPSSVTINVNDVAISGLNADNNGPTVLGQPTTFTATVIAGTNVAYSWDFGNGDTATGATVNYTFTSTGSRTVTLTATNGAGSTSTTTLVSVTNTAPLANAGATQNVLVGANVTLDGRASSDPDGHTPLTFAWTQTGGPAVSLSGANTAQPSFTAPATPTVLSFQLIVTDARGLASTPNTTVVNVRDAAPQNVTATNNGPTTLGQLTQLSATAQGTNLTYSWDLGDGNSATGATVNHTYADEGTYIATVTVSNSTGTVGTDSTSVTITNLAPLANAGPDQEVDLGANVILSASASSDPDGHTPLSFAWTQISGTPVTLTGTDTATARFRAPNQVGRLTFELTVTDSRGKSANDTVVIIVGDEPITGLTASSDGPTVLGQPTTFTASATTGTSISYNWDFGGGASASGATAQHIFPTEGTFTVTLTARNALGTQTRTVAVTVTNAAPVVEAGSNQEVQAGTFVTLAGSATDPDGHTPLSFTWTQIAGPTVSLNGANRAEATFTAPDAEVLLSFQLTVADAFGKTSSDTVNVQVRREATAPSGFQIYLPLMRSASQSVVATPPADLQISAFSVTPANLEPGTPAQISVTVVNTGATATGAFWVDLYINPNSPPTAAGTRWEQTCTLEPCQGIAWLVVDGIAPGGSITLTSDATSYYAPNTRWNGSFAPGTNAVYVYVDSWNEEKPGGAVNEADETNNRREVIIALPGTASITSTPSAPRLPSRFLP